MPLLITVQLSIAVLFIAAKPPTLPLSLILSTLVTSEVSVVNSILPLFIALQLYNIPLLVPTKQLASLFPNSFP